MSSETYGLLSCRTGIIAEVHHYQACLISAEHSTPNGSDTFSVRIIPKQIDATVHNGPSTRFTGPNKRPIAYDDLVRCLYDVVKLIDSVAFSIDDVQLRFL